MRSNQDEKMKQDNTGNENEELRNAGLKVTTPRIKMLQTLRRADPHHMSAEDLYRQFLEDGEEIPLATVYRVLAQFESSGLVEKHNFDGGHSVFELAGKDHHDHIVCIDCGKVTEFRNALIEREQEKVAENLGFQLEHHSLCLYATCTKPRCEFRVNKSR